ncbi:MULTISPECIES: rod shape-determining protein MreC [unclassified Nitratiruptor]|uniref:rod shape-determining protein MreC n=1 Tax=unclassified Nitratiruptor TaxID=2624044 RepID=UPI00191684A9|nr:MULTISPECIES: rod shape-determining protein MreC [unclassified Nitratiruptor]BCD59843.1 rod shape-determining protein MreC [Nitratiruptor sp. YY08-10]BCD63766.1 rod shape-determining protein MreC [Nitratiruptor sp. YY08-14]
MNRKLFLFLFTALLAVLLFFTNTLFKDIVLGFTFGVKKEYLQLKRSFDQFLEEHLNQQQTIQKLRAQNRELFKYKVLYSDLEDRYRALLQDCKIFEKTSLKVESVEALSYVKLGDFTTLWIDADIPKEGIVGALKGAYVAGIAIGEDKRSKLLLLGNKKCSFGVQVGAKAYGIAIGNGDNRFTIVKYIPNYEHIHVGDEVVTNGLDGIFVYGIKVGRVVEIKHEGSYKIAKVRNYADLSHPRFFWLMKL